MLKATGKFSKMDTTNNSNHLTLLSSSSSTSSMATANGSGSGGTMVVVTDGHRQPVSNNCLFHFYVSNFFKIPKDIKNDIIYCQRSLKTHIKIHQMVLDVFEQQPDADPIQKKRILDELESEMYEINAEQQFLILRVRRIIDEFYRSLKERNIPIDADFTNNIVSKEIVPFINDTRLIITPVNVLVRSTEEKLIEKYFEVQNDLKESDIIELDDESVIEMLDEKDALRKMIKSNETQNGNNKFTQSITSVNIASGESLLLNNTNGIGAGTATPAVVPTQKSLLKPMNQRMSIDGLINNISVTTTVATASGAGAGAGDNDMQPKITAAFSLYNAHMPNKSQLIPGNEGDSIGAQSNNKNESLKSVERPVPPSVKMSRMNLRQALKRAQAAVRGPSTALVAPTLSSVPPPLAPIQTVPAVLQPKKKVQQQQQQSQQQQQHQQQPSTKVFNVNSQATATIASVATNTIASVTVAALVKKQTIGKTKAARNAVAAVSTAPVTASATITTSNNNQPVQQSTTTSSNSVGVATNASGSAGGLGAVKTPEPTSSSAESSPERELEETRTKAIEYGQEMFLRIFDLFTPQAQAQMQQRRSKRRRRCVQKNARSMYHYGKIEPNATINNSEMDQKKKRKAFLLSPHTKKQLPNKRPTKRTSADKNVNSSGNGIGSGSGSGSGSSSGNNSVNGCDAGGRGNSDNASRSSTTSPVEKNNNCHVCLKTDRNLEQCMECLLWYHITCYDDPPTDQIKNQFSEKPKIITCNELCPPCKKHLVADFKNESRKNECLLNTIRDLELLVAKERDRKEILLRTTKSYKVQMSVLYHTVKAIKNHRTEAMNNDDDVIMLD